MTWCDSHSIESLCLTSIDTKDFIQKSHFAKVFVFEELKLWVLIFYITVGREWLRRDLLLGAWRFVFFSKVCDLIQVKEMCSPCYFLFIYIILSTVARTQTCETVNVKCWGEAAEAVTPSLFKNLVQP